MSTTLTPAQVAWVNLPTEVKESFNNIAYKDGNPDLDGFDWFEHLVPDSIKGQPDMVSTFMDGGTVTKDVYVYDQGRASGHYEQVEFNIADKDVSRIQSGANGGEYTPDNTVMENSSTNRARQAEDMSTEEFESISEANAAEAEILDGAEILSETTDSAQAGLETMTTAAEAGGFISEATGTAVDLLSDAVAPAIGAYIAGKKVSEQFETTQDQLGYGALAAGGGALLCLTPIGQTGLAIYCGAKIGMKVGKWLGPKVKEALG